MAASKELNIAALAFIGDAVYEVYVRKHVMETGVAHSDVLHKWRWNTSPRRDRLRPLRR